MLLKMQAKQIQAQIEGLQHDSNLLGPLHIQNQMIIAKTRHTGNSTSRIISMVKVNECKSLNMRKQQSDYYQNNCCKMTVSDNNFVPQS